MRHLFLVVDNSKAMKEADLLRPSRIACAEKVHWLFSNLFSVFSNIHCNSISNTVQSLVGTELEHGKINRKHSETL